MHGYSPLHWLEVVQKWTEAATAFKQHGAKAPVVHGDGVGLILKKLRRLQRSGFLIFHVQHSGTSFINLVKKRAQICLQESRCEKMPTPAYDTADLDRCAGRK